MAKKGYNYPIKKKIPLILLLNLFGITIISHFLRFVNIFREVLSHYLPGGKKAFLREEGGTRQGFPEANEMSFGGSLRSVTEGARVT